MVDMDKYRGIRWKDHRTLKQARIALDMMRDFHGKSLNETHGDDGDILEKRLGVKQWDKDHEYKVWLQDILLRVETATDPDDVFTEDEWQSVEAYATESTGINESVVLKGNKFRKLYFACSQKRGCVKIEGSNIDVNNDCRKKCLEEAVIESGF